jgi:predicted  nucleic acid-binding Zn-ribbon protein
MSHLDILKDQMNAMGDKIEQIQQEMRDLEIEISQFTEAKNKIEEQLTNAENRFTTLSNNHKYLTEVQKETTNNYNQIEDAATTLLEIIRSKCDNIS